MKRRSNFTLVEIIAVLLIIAIMAAVAAPKFISLADEAKVGAAQAGINEAKAALSVAYAKAYLAASGTPTLASVANYAFGTGSPLAFTSGSTVAMGDIPVVVTVNAGDIGLSAAYDSGTAVTDTWVLPTFTVTP